MVKGYSKQIQEWIGNALERTVFVNSDFADIVAAKRICSSRSRSGGKYDFSSLMLFSKSGINDTVHPNR